MNAKDKAMELLDRFYMGDDFPVKCGTYCEGGTPDYKGIAKKCALLCVDEILRNFGLAQDSMFLASTSSTIYWERVNREIEKL